MNYDSIYLIGKSHKVCEDYAYADENCLIVSDGCSSSRNSDVGARILVQCAKMHCNMLKIYGFYKEFGYVVISQAKSIANSLKLNEECLDATLIIAVKNNDYLDIYMYGDGIIIIQYEKKIEFSDVRFESSAPFYLSYWLNPGRLKNYAREFNKPIFINGKIAGNFDMKIAYSYKINNRLLPRIKSAMIASDGLNSFLDLPQGDKIELATIINQGLSFKSLKGEYLKRRIIKMIKDYANRNIYHLDDVALANYCI